MLVFFKNKLIKFIQSTNKGMYEYAYDNVCE